MSTIIIVIRKMDSLSRYSDAEAISQTCLLAVRAYLSLLLGFYRVKAKRASVALVEGEKGSRIASKPRKGFFIFCFFRLQKLNAADITYT